MAETKPEERLGFFLCRHLRLFDCSELREHAEEIAKIAGLCDPPPLERDIGSSRGPLFSFVSVKALQTARQMGCMQRPTNYDPIVRSDSIVLLHEVVELPPVASMDGSRRVVGVVSPFHVVLKAIEPLTETG